MSTPTRRTFIATTSLAFAGTLLRTRGLRAQPLPQSIATSDIAASSVLPETFAPHDLRTLASSAIEAATRAGAAYADVRVGERHWLFVEGHGGGDPIVSLKSTVTYGVRVLVDGAWAFSYGSIPALDPIVATARNAVATARGYTSLVTRRMAFAPAPVVTGEWATPITEDPFAVPLRDHSAALFALGLASDRQLTARQYSRQLEWTKETRVFASSEGSLTTQTLHTLDPLLSATGRFVDPHYTDGVYMRYPELSARAGGFELLAKPAMQEDLTRWTEEVARIASLPRGTLDIGKYPVVFDGRSVGVALGTTLGRALELDRALGEEAAASGTSLLTPPSEFLGTVIACRGRAPSPLRRR
jgi:TldD protein